MIRDEEIIAALTSLAEREGTTKAEALHRVLAAFAEKISVSETERPLFPRDRVHYRTYSI